MVIILNFCQKKCVMCVKKDQNFQVVQIIFSLNINTNSPSSTLKKVKFRIKENDDKKL